MTTLLNATQKGKLRADGHRSRFYLSVSKPVTLLSATVNNGSIAHGAVAIAFDAGTAADVGRIKAGQTARVTLASGKKFQTTVLSFTSSGASPTLTGTLTVHANAIAWEDNAGLEVIEDWQPRPIPPTFDANTGISKKRGQTFSTQTKQPPPVCVAGPQRVGLSEPVQVTGSVDVRIAAGADDGIVASDGSALFASLTENPLSYNGVAYNWVWLRFAGDLSDIPPGATITAAYVRFRATANDAATITYKIYGDDSDSATAPAVAADYTGKALTGSFVSWAIGSWVSGGDHDTPDISPVIQDIVDRPGFAGVAQLLVRDASAAGTVYKPWRAYEGDPNLAPLLHVEYTYTAYALTVDVDLSDSYALAPGATIASYGLTVAPAGPTVTFNTGTGIGTIETATPGQYWLEGTVTDSNSNVHKTYRRIFAHSPDPDNAEYPYVDFTAQGIGPSWENSGQGTFVVQGVADFGAFVDGALVVLWQRAWYGDEGPISLVTGGEGILFSGYIDGDTIEQDYQHGTVSFKASNVMALARTLPMQGLSIHAESNPAYWFQYDHRLTIARALHWLWYWHSTMFEVADVFLPSNGLYKKLFKFNEGSLFSQAQELAGKILANVTCNAAGQVYIEQDIQLLDASGRAAVDVLTEITPADWRESVTIMRRHRPAQAAVKLTGYVFDGQVLTPYCSIAPGRIRSEAGSGIPVYDGMVLSGQAQANMLTGRLHAQANNDIAEVRIRLSGNYSVMDVAPQRWLTMSLASADTARGIVWTDYKLVPRQVIPTLDTVNGLLLTDIVCEAEALGPDGITDPCPIVPDAVAVTPPWTGRDAAGLDALVTFSSVNIRDDGAADWIEQNAGDADHGTLDRWWTIKQESTNPEEAIVWWVEGGKIYRSVDAGITPIDVTPAESPPDTWLDTPAPAIEDLTFVQIFSDSWVQDRFFALARWQNGDGDWRGWLAVTATDGVSWEWVPLYDGVTLPDQIKPLWLTANGSYILVTTWQDDDSLQLLAFDAATLEYADQHGLGTTTLAEADAKTYIAYPAVVLDDDDLWYLFGRMNAPAGLAGTQHVIKTADAGTAWTSVESGWGADRCVAMDVGLLDGGDRSRLSLREIVPAGELVVGTPVTVATDGSITNCIAVFIRLSSTQARLFDSANGYADLHTSVVSDDGTVTGRATVTQRSVAPSFDGLYLQGSPLPAGSGTLLDGKVPVGGGAQYPDVVRGTDTSEEALTAVAKGNPQVAFAMLTDTTAILAIQDEYRYITSVNGTPSETTHSSVFHSSSQMVAAEKVSSTVALILYYNGAASGQLYLALANSSGSLADNEAFSDTATNLVTPCLITLVEGSEYLVVYGEPNSSQDYHLKLVRVHVSGSAITCDSPVTVKTGDANTGYVAGNVDRVDNTSFVMVYQERDFTGGPDEDQYIEIFDADTGATINTRQALATNNDIDANFLNVCALDSSHFLASYYNRSAKQRTVVAVTL